MPNVAFGFSLMVVGLFTPIGNEEIYLARKGSFERMLIISQK